MEGGERAQRVARDVLCSGMGTFVIFCSQKTGAGNIIAIRKAYLFVKSITA